MSIKLNFLNMCISDCIIVMHMPLFYPLATLTHTTDLTTIKATLTPEMRQDECIKHALSIQSAFAIKNYHRFFKLSRGAPKMSGYLIDWFVERVRKDGLKLVVKSYVFWSYVVLTVFFLGGDLNSVFLNYFALKYFHFQIAFRCKTSEVGKLIVYNIIACKNFRYIICVIW